MNYWDIFIIFGIIMSILAILFFFRESLGLIIDESGQSNTFSEVVKKIPTYFYNKTTWLILLGILLFSIFFSTTLLFSEKKANYLLEEKRYNEAILYLNRLVYENSDFNDKTKNYHKLMAICDNLVYRYTNSSYEQNHNSCNKEELSKHMLEQEQVTPEANLYLALNEVDGIKIKLMISNMWNGDKKETPEKYFEQALDYLKPVKDIYPEVWTNLYNGKYEYLSNQRLENQEEAISNEINKTKNSQYTLLNITEDFISDTLDNLKDFELRGTEEEIAQKVFQKMTAQGRIIGRVKTARKLIRKYFNYSKIQRIKKLILEKKKKALVEKKDYSYTSSISNYRKKIEKKTKDKIKHFKQCLKYEKDDCYKLLEL